MNTEPLRQYSGVVLGGSLEHVESQVHCLEVLHHILLVVDQVQECCDVAPCEEAVGTECFKDIDLLKHKLGGPLVQDERFGDMSCQVCQLKKCSNTFRFIVSSVSRLESVVLCCCHICTRDHT